MGEPLVNFGILGKHCEFRNLEEPVRRTWGTIRGGAHSAAVKKLSKNPVNPLELL